MLQTREGSNVAQTGADLAQIEKRLVAFKLIGYDAETDGLDPYANNIVGHVFTFGPSPGDTFYVPVRHAAGGNIEPVDKFDRMLARIAKLEGKHWFGHNVQFDLRFLNRHGIRVVGTLEDTQVNAAIINELASSFSLDASCRALGAIEKKGEELYIHLASHFGCKPDRDAMAHFYKLAGTDPVATDYATGDGIATWDLRLKQIEAIQAEKLDYTYHLEQRITRVIYRMHLRGIKVDTEELARVKQFAAAKVEEAMSYFPDGFNARSTPAVRKWLESQGHYEAPYTPKGAKMAAEGDYDGADKCRSYNEAYLKTIPSGQLVLDVRKYSTLNASFINPLLQRHLRPDGRVHCSYYQMATDGFGTVTGRFSCADPNLQQVPKRNRDLGLSFRRVFVPDPGSEWLTADLSQCEPRILAHYSGAESLVQGYLSDPPMDAHAAVTVAAGLEKMLGIPFKEAREYGKRLNQTLLTGGGKGKIIDMLGERGAEVYDAYFRGSPEIRTLLKAAEGRFRTRGYIISYLGRRARLRSPDKAYVAANRLFQCVAAGTKVTVPSGYKNIEDIQPGDLVYSYNDDLKLCLRRVTWAGQTGIRKLYRLKWRSGGGVKDYLDCTDDHQIRLIDGSYKTVAELIKIPLKEFGRLNRYYIRTLALHRGEQGQRERRNFLWSNGYNRVLEARFVFEQIHGYLPEIVHHKDGNTLNDRPDNLEGYSTFDHNSHHAVIKAQLKTPEERKALSAKAVAASNLSRFTEERRKAALKGSKAFHDKRINNHVIYDIEELPGRHPVYDITVEDTHNYIANEICVHNCGNADIIKQTLADIDDYFERETKDQVYLLNTVHDSVDLNVPEGMRDIALKGLRFMTQYGPHRRFYLKVPMACEYAFGPSWGDATYLAEQHMLGQNVNDESFYDLHPVKPTPELANAAD